MVDIVILFPRHNGLKYSGHRPAAKMYDYRIAGMAIPSIMRPYNTLVKMAIAA